MEPVTMDLGDFIPEEYELRFKINGNPYLVRFEEAHVDEVLELILNSGETGIKSQRKTVTTFCQNHIVEGDKGQLAIDLEKVPYANKAGGLSIQQLMEKINGRVKKNGPGDEKAETATKK